MYWFTLFVSGLLASVVLGVEVPLQSISELRQLSSEAIISGRDVRFQGAVVDTDRENASLFVSDGVKGLFVHYPVTDAAPQPQWGDRIEVRGRIDRGQFANIVIIDPFQTDHGVRVLEKNQPPVALSVTGSELMEPARDCDWVHLQAHVIEVNRRDQQFHLSCEIDHHAFEVIVRAPVPPQWIPWHLAECDIELSGVATTQFNTARQMTQRFVRISRVEDIKITRNATSPDQSARAISVDALFREDGPRPQELIKIQGISTLVLPGKGFYLRSNGGGIWVQTAQPIAAAPGTFVECEGWARLGEIKPFLRARQATILAYGVPISPLPLVAKAALNSRHDSELISVEAELLDVIPTPEGHILDLRDTGLVFRATIDGNHDLESLDLRPESRLRITGIAQIMPSQATTPLLDDAKLHIHMRGLSDIAVLKLPAFWTTQRIVTGAVLIIAAMLSALWLSYAKRRREQELQHREFNAILAERGRFAREIHDSLAQGLTSISLQLECVRDELHSAPHSAAQHVETARTLVRDSLHEARRTVWNLRPLALGRADLIHALQHYADQLNSGGRIQMRQLIEGTPRPLAPMIEDTLLRIGQEALTNAVKHAKASEITVRLSFSADWLSISVGDNGCGFDVASNARRGFGLTSMNERIAALGGSLSIDSHPGEGTEVSATLPT